MLFTSKSNYMRFSRALFIGMQMRFIWSSKVWELDHDLNKLCVRFVLCIGLELSIDSAFENSLSIAGIFEFVIEMLYDIREIVLLVIKKSILYHSCEHEKNFLAHKLLVVTNWISFCSFEYWLFLFLEYAHVSLPHYHILR